MTDILVQVSKIPLTCSLLQNIQCIGHVRSSVVSVYIPSIIAPGMPCITPSYEHMSVSHETIIAPGMPCITPSYEHMSVSHETI